MSDQFRTYQTVRRYEDALVRHGQWLRWIQATKCPCVRSETMQPDPQCTLCGGRGRLYREPETFSIVGELKTNSEGRITPNFAPIVPGTVSVFHKGAVVPLGSQPVDGSYIQLAQPYPKPYRPLSVNYSYTPYVSVTAENSEVYDSARYILRTIASRFSDEGKSFEGSVKSVSRVYNVDRDETYEVDSISKEFVTLIGLGTWQSGDMLEVDYLYIKPFNFMLTGVTGRMRYEQPYVLEDADAVLVTPYWAQPAPEDLFTALAQEQIGTVVIDPRTAAGGNDKITSFFDLSRLLRVVSKAGTEYTPGIGNDVEIFGRDELKWNVTKPAVPYTVQFTYHPTYTALTNLHTLRNSENKSFVNRVSVKLFDRTHEKVTY